jgi:hypothetical protein
VSVLDNHKRPAAAPALSGPLNTFDESECCSKLLAAELLKGTLAAAKRWECPGCGEEWRPDMVGAVRHWTMRPAFLFRGKVRKT